MTYDEHRDQAADEAYRDHAADVYRVAYAILRDPEEAMDTTHDAFARAWERWDQYDSQRPLRGWLHGIVVHLALDHLRRRRVRRLALPALGTQSLSARTTEDPADEVARRELVEMMLDGLRPMARATLVLRHYYGYEYARIGTMLGIRSGTVGSTLARAHAAIRERLEALDPPRVVTPAPRGRPRDRRCDQATSAPEVSP